MSVFEYMDPRSAVYNDRDHATTGGIRGLMAADADWCTRTATGNAREPEQPWIARGHLDKFKRIARVEIAKDADPGTIEVFWTDGTASILHRGDLLCVERPIGGRSEFV